MTTTLFYSDTSVSSNCWIECDFASVAPMEVFDVASSFTVKPFPFAKQCALSGYPDAIFHPNHWNDRKGSGYQKKLLPVSSICSSRDRCETPMQNLGYPNLCFTHWAACFPNPSNVANSELAVRHALCLNAERSES